MVTWFPKNKDVCEIGSNLILIFVAESFDICSRLYMSVCSSISFFWLSVFVFLSYIWLAVCLFRYMLYVCNFPICNSIFYLLSAYMFVFLCNPVNTFGLSFVCLFFNLSLSTVWLSFSVCKSVFHLFLPVCLSVYFFYIFYCVTFILSNWS